MSSMTSCSLPPMKPSRRRQRSSDRLAVKRYTALLMALATATTTIATTRGGGGTASNSFLVHAHSANPDESSSTAMAVRSKGKNHPSHSSNFGLRPKTIMEKPTLVFQPHPTPSLSERYSALLNARGAVGGISHVDSESTDFLEKLRAAEAEEEERKRRTLEGATHQAECPARPGSNLVSKYVPDWARQSIKSSAFLVLATVLIEIDWGRLFSDLNQASSVFLSIAWLPLLWMRPGGRNGDGNGPALETLVVYLLAVLRPSFLVHVWRDVLVPHTIPTLHQMVVREGWSLLWKGLLMPVMPQLPKDSTGWAAIHVFVLQAIHKGTMKLFTSNIQRHVQSSMVRVGQKSIQLLHDLWSRYRGV